MKKTTELATYYGVIYRVINMVNGKVYIGQTINFVSRKKEHLRTAKRKNNICFYRAINKYGSDNFKWEIVDHAPTKAIIDYKEKLWIIKSNSLVPSGYNMTTGG